MVKRTNTAGQLEARAENPELATVEGRVRREVLNTLKDVTYGFPPSTVLGALARRHRFDDPREPMSVPQIAARVRGRDAWEPDETGDVFDDTLADLIEVGLVEEFDAENTAETALKQETRPKYRLATAREVSVDFLDDRA